MSVVTIRYDVQIQTYKHSLYRKDLPCTERLIQNFLEAKIWHWEMIKKNTT